MSFNPFSIVSGIINKYNGVLSFTAMVHQSNDQTEQDLSYLVFIYVLPILLTTTFMHANVLPILSLKLFMYHFFFLVQELNHHRLKDVCIWDLKSITKFTNWRISIWFFLLLQHFCCHKNMVFSYTSECSIFNWINWAVFMLHTEQYGWYSMYVYYNTKRSSGVTCIC